MSGRIREASTARAPEMARELRRGRRSWSALTGGGTDGNEALTATVGIVLLVLFAGLGLTILRIRQLIWVHLFVGLALLGPVALKLASTGYRFMRYYLGDGPYRLKGPPGSAMRLIAPGVVSSTLVVFASGIALLAEGPPRRAQWLGIHKVSFIVWLVFIGLHVLGHLGHLPASLRAAHAEEASAGRAGRWITLSGALAGGIVLALVLIPQFAAWTAPGAFPHHHH